LRLIGIAFAALALYLLVQSTVVLSTGFHPQHSPVGIAWTAMTATVMFALAAGKARTGAALANPVLTTEGRVTLIDGLLATAVLLGLLLNSLAGCWWAPTQWPDMSSSSTRCAKSEKSSQVGRGVVTRTPGAARHVSHCSVAHAKREIPGQTRRCAEITARGLSMKRLAHAADGLAQEFELRCDKLVDHI
jgi:hypothetical protein